MSARQSSGRQRFFDALLAVLLMTATSVIGWQLLKSTWQGAHSGRFYAPAVMFAAGNGLHGVSVEEIPRLRDFLDLKLSAISAKELPAEPRLIELDFNQGYVPYLLYAIGIAWRLFGISWQVIIIPIIFLFALNTLALYGLFRLGAGRALSSVGVLLASAGTLPMLENLEDFPKSPFVLTSIFVLLYIVKRPPKTTHLLAFAALLGVVQGIGLGFRRDLAVCVPPTLLVLGLSELDASTMTLRKRAAAAILFCLCFVVPAFPVLNAFRQYHSDNVGTHVTLMGMATEEEDRMAVQRASYERIALRKDCFVSAAASSYATRAKSVSGEIPPMGKSDLLREFVKTFPADMITRAYAAVLRILTSNVTEGLLPDLRTVSLLSTALFFMALSWSAPRKTGIILLLLMYFCGHTSIQFELRHVFHLGFLQFWFPLCLVNRIPTVGGEIDKLLSRRQESSIDADRSRIWRQRLQRTALFWMAAAVICFGPLYACRIYQYCRVEEMLSAFRSADLESVPFKQRPLGAYVLFSPIARAACSSATYLDERTSSRTEYWVAEFTREPESPHFWLRYEAKGDPNDFSAPFLIDPTNIGGTGTFRCFFPVYEDLDPARWSCFVGVALPGPHRDQLKGLYRVRNLRDFPLLLNASVPENAPQFRHWQTVGSFHYVNSPLFVRRPIPDDPRIEAEAALSVLLQSDAAGSAERYGAALESNSGNIMLLLGLGKAYEAQGNLDMERNAYRDAIESLPFFVAPYESMDIFLQKHGSPTARVDAWRQIAASHPGEFYAHLYLGNALQTAGLLAQCLDAYRLAVSLAPCHAAGHAGLASAERQMGNMEGALLNYQEALRLNPADKSIKEAVQELRKGDSKPQIVK